MLRTPTWSWTTEDMRQSWESCNWFLLLWLGQLAPVNHFISSERNWYYRFAYINENSGSLSDVRVWWRTAESSAFKSELSALTPLMRQVSISVAFSPILRSWKSHALMGSKACPCGRRCRFESLISHSRNSKSSWGLRILLSCSSVYVSPFSVKRLKTIAIMFVHGLYCFITIIDASIFVYLFVSV